MAEEIQKIGWDTTRALCEAGAVPREPVLNTGSGDTFGPELIISEDDGTTFHRFPSLGRMGEIDFSDSIGFDDSGLTNLSGTTIQGVLASIDLLLNPTTELSLADVSLVSLTTEQQTFQLKDSTSLIFKDSLGVNLFEVTDTDFNITANGVLTISSLDNGIGISSPFGISITTTVSGDIAITTDNTHFISMDSVAVLLTSTMSLRFGNSLSEGDWQIIRSGTSLAMQRYESSAWVTKSTITA